MGNRSSRFSSSSRNPRWVSTAKALGIGAAFPGVDAALFLFLFSDSLEVFLVDVGNTLFSSAPLYLSHVTPLVRSAWKRSRHVFEMIGSYTFMALRWLGLTDFLRPNGPFIRVYRILGFSLGCA